MAPDLPTPSGGIKVIYRYVEHLCALGHDARVWHGTPGFAYESWGSTAPVDTGTELEFACGRRARDARDRRLEVELPVARGSRS